MAAIVVKAFNGLKPISDNLLLDNSDAQVANNVLLNSGTMRSLRDITTLKTTAKFAPKTIYRFDPENNQGEGSYWLEFANDTDVMRSPIALDQWDRLYWTDGANIPKYAPASIVITTAGDGSMPGGGYDLGVPKPTTAPVISGFTAPETVEKVTRTYVLTYWNPTTAKESAPGRTFTVKTLDGEVVKITGLPTDNKGDTGITAKRLYRLVPDIAPAITETYRRIAEIPLAETTYEDSTTDAAAALLPPLPAAVTNAPPSPVTPPLVAAVTAVATAPAVTYQYYYTMANFTWAGDPIAESAPSSPVNVTADLTQSVTLSGFANPAAAEAFRIYRKDPDKQQPLLVVQIPYTQTTFVDVLALTQLQTPIGEMSTNPATAPSPVTFSVGASAAVSTVKRLYMVTFVDNAAHESGKSPSSEIVTVVNGQTSVALNHYEPIPAGVTKKRLYRQDISLSSGVIVANDANWRFVAENTATATNAVDVLPDSGLPGGYLPAGLQGLPPSPTGVGSASSTIEAPATPESRVYCYTYVTEYDEEGPPSPSSEVVSVDPSEPVTVGMAVGPSGNYNITKKRLYRSATGTNRTKFQLVNETDIAIATTSYTDDTPTSELGELLPSETWIPPPVGLKGLRLMANGAAVGFVGNSLYLSELNRPHAWPHEYPIDDEIIGIGVYGQTVAVLTRSFPYLFQGIDPLAMASTKLELPQACVAKRSVVETGDGVLYASPDGLIQLGSGVSLVTNTILTRAQWQALNPASMECYVHNGRVIITYSAGWRGILIFDISGAGALFTTSDVNGGLPFSAGHYCAHNDTLYFAKEQSIVRYDSGAGLMSTWRSKTFRQPQHENFGFGQVICKSYSPPSIFKVYADGALKHTKLVGGPDAFRLPGGFKALDWEFEIVGSVEVTEVFIANSSAELQSA